MKNLFIATLLAPSLSLACADLTGIFTFPGSSTLEITQSKDLNNLTTYKMIIDDGTCALCHSKEIFVADGVLKKKSYGQAEEATQISCDENRLKFRRTTIYFDDSGAEVFKEVTHQDYRINDENNLAIENIENEEAVSKVVCNRLN